MPINLLITNTLELFKKILGEALLIEIDRNRADLGSITRGLSRPDFLCWLKEALVLIGEEKAGAENLKMALEDLEEKFDRIDPLIYSNIKVMQRQGRNCVFMQLMGRRMLRTA